MTGRRAVGVRAVVAALTAWAALAGAGVADAAAPASAAGLRYAARARLAPGVEYREFTVPTPRGTAYGHLVTVDLSHPGTVVDLLYPGTVAARAPVSRLADARGAVAAVNGDFFNLSEAQHPGVEATNAPVGPAVADGRALKAAVPNAQRFGPALPPGTSAKDVIGVAADRTARLDRLALHGSVTTSRGTLPLRGLNQYAVAVGGIGEFTAAWGGASRARAVCGTDTSRGAACSRDTYEVTVRQGRVSAVADTPGAGDIPSGTVVLVGREDGADALRQLAVGDPVEVSHRLDGAGGSPLRFAIGGYPVLRGDAALDGLDTSTAATRTSAGIGGAGRRLLLLALERSDADHAGVTIAELAELMRQLGARDAVNLDGGGSSTLAARAPGGAGATVRNFPPGAFERPVANAIGVFAAV